MVRSISTTSKLASHELMVHRDSGDNNAQTPFEFTEANMARISALCCNYPIGCQRSIVLAALDIAQRQMGWVPIAAMNKVALILNIPRIRVYEVATFFTMNKRRFRGKYNVKVCVTTPCMIRGSDVILRAVEQACACPVGGLSKDGMFGVDEVQCAGACVNAPVLVIDDDYFEDVNVSDVENIINTIKAGAIPPPGPQSGRFCCEPSGGLTSLCSEPPGPGFKMQPGLEDSPPPCPPPQVPKCLPPVPPKCPPPPPPCPPAPPSCPGAAPKCPKKC